MCSQLRINKVGFVGYIKVEYIKFINHKRAKRPNVAVMADTWFVTQNMSQITIIITFIYFSFTAEITMIKQRNKVIKEEIQIYKSLRIIGFFKKMNLIVINYSAPNGSGLEKIFDLTREKCK
jgi:hypothetical protein